MNRLLFEKTGNAIFISHLDLIRAFQRSFRRAGMLLKHSQGFTPHAYVSILLPLSVGVSSQCEIMDFELDPSDKTPLEQVPALLNRSLPDGVRVLKYYQSDRKPKELVYLHASVTLEYDGGVKPEAVDAIRGLFERQQILVPKQTKSGEIVQQDLKELIRCCTVEQAEQCICIDCVVHAQNPSLNPMQLAKAVTLHLPEYAPDFASSHRIALLDGDGKPFF